MRVLDQLVAIAVTGDNGDIPAGVAGLGGQSGDHIVGLVALSGGHREPEGVNQLPDQVQLLVEAVLLLLPVRLVRREPLVAESTAGQVEGHGDAVGLVLAQQRGQHLGKAEDGVRLLAGPRDHVARDGEERPVGQRIPVEEEESRHRGDPTGRP